MRMLRIYWHSRHNHGNGFNYYPQTFTEEVANKKIVILNINNRDLKHWVTPTSKLEKLLMLVMERRTKIIFQENKISIHTVQETGVRKIKWFAGDNRYTNARQYILGWAYHD